MTKIIVYPTKASALNVKHDTDGPLRATGSQWELDGYTSRLLVDGILTRDPAKAYAPPPAAAPVEAEPSDDAAAKQ